MKRKRKSAMSPLEASSRHVVDVALDHYAKFGTKRIRARLLGLTVSMTFTKPRRPPTLVMGPLPATPPEGHHD